MVFGGVGAILLPPPGGPGGGGGGGGGPPKLKPKPDDGKGIFFLVRVLMVMVLCW